MLDSGSIESAPSGMYLENENNLEEPFFKSGESVHIRSVELNRFIQNANLVLASVEDEDAQLQEYYSGGV
jgi:hypothetical protein